MAHRFLRRKALLEATGLSAATIYRRERQGLFIHPVRLGPKAVGWPSGEVEAISAALTAGQSDEQIQGLVAKLHAARYPGGKPPANMPQPMKPVKPGRPRKTPASQPRVARTKAANDL